MVPSAFVVLERLPLTPNGKLDRRALPAPERGVAVRASPGAAHARRRRCCARCLPRCSGSSGSGLDDNFFELGGHSLLATRLIGRVRASLGVEVAIRSLFEAPSVAALARRLSSEPAAIARAAHGAAAAAGGAAVLCAAAAVVPGAALERTGWRAAAPRALTASRRLSRRGTYSIPLAVRLVGCARPRGACGCAERPGGAAREPAHGVPGDGGACRGRRCFAASAARLALAISASTEAELAAALSAAAGRGFELSRELPLRAHLFAMLRPLRARLSHHEHVLLLVLHHIAGDGWSLRPLLRDLGALYRARCEGGAAAVPVLPVQYADYTLWQRAVLGDEGDAASAIGRQLAYWKGALQDLPEQIELPADRGASCGVEPPRRPCADRDRCRAAPRAFGAVAVDRARACSWCCRRGSSALLTRLGAGTDIALGSPIAGPRRCGAGRTGRVLRQHAGAAHRHVGQPGLRCADRAGAVAEPCGLCAPGAAVRAAGGGAEPGSARCRGIRCSR